MKTRTPLGVTRSTSSTELLPVLCRVLGVPDLQRLKSFSVSMLPGEAPTVTLELYVRLDEDLAEIIKAHTLLNGGGQ